MKFNKTNLAKIFVLMVLVAGIGYAAASIGRFTPTHAIVEPVYCGSCHPDQIRELNATTHLPHFAGAIYEEAEAIAAGSSSEITQAEAVSGACMMCHNTWANRDRVFLSGYELVSDATTGESRLKFNDVVFKSTDKTGTGYDIAVGATFPQTIRLGTNVASEANFSKITVTVQDPGTSGLAAGTKLNSITDFAANGTDSIDLLGTGSNVSSLSAGNGSIKIVYTVGSGITASLKTVWGDLSAKSPTPGQFVNDQQYALSANKGSCGNPEKGFCHAVETVVGKNMMNQMAENKFANPGSGNGIYFQHEMAYTSAEYAAKQVKLCVVCHFNKLPPMTADGEPIRQDVGTERVVRSSHGALILDTQNLTTVSSDWAHKQVQCIRCHSHAGIGGEDALTGVRSP